MTIRTARRHAGIIDCSRLFYLMGVSMVLGALVSALAVAF
jgi:hypothetical protein